MRALRFPVALISVLAGVACVEPQPAPDDVDGLARFMLANWDPGEEDPSVSDQELADAILKVVAAIDGENLAAPTKGSLANLTQAELDAVGLPDKDPNKPQGMFITDILRCDLEQIEEIALNPDQLSLYPEAYAEYSRTFVADTPEFQPRWNVTYTSSENALVTNQFTATVNSGMRRVPDLGPELSPHGRGLIFRVVLPEPGTFESDGSEFTDDFQVEMLVPRAPGELVHFYAMWRYMRLGILGDSYDAVFIDQTTQGMIDWNRKTEEICAQ